MRRVSRSRMASTRTTAQHRRISLPSHLHPSPYTRRHSVITHSPRPANLSLTHERVSPLPDLVLSGGLHVHRSPITSPSSSSLNEHPLKRTPLPKLIEGKVTNGIEGQSHEPRKVEKSMDAELAKALKVFFRDVKGVQRKLQDAKSLGK